MSVTSFTDLSVVRLKDGRRGTVVHIYENGEGAKQQVALVEIDDNSLDLPEKLVNVLPDDVAAVEWVPHS